MQESHNMDIVQSLSIDIIKPESKFSWRKGIDMYLTHAGNRICMNSSSWSGAQRVYLNGELAISRRVLIGKKSTYVFSIDNNHYVLVHHFVSYIKGLVTSTLYANAKEVDFEIMKLQEHITFG
jgi:hypothetical protein